MDDLPPRVRAVCDLDVAEAREYSGRHEYDGKIQDLSPGGVRDGLARLAEAAASGDRAGDAHDESHLAAFERRAQVAYGELELHRSNPLAHLAEMDLACYDRDYAPAQEREQAKLAHLALWPQAVDAALASGIPGTAPPAVASAARAAHRRLVAHVERAARQGNPDAALGAAGLRSLMSTSEDIDVDLGALAERADAERDRLLNRLAEDCARIDANRPPLELCRDLVRDHPGTEGVIQAARIGTEQAIEFTRDRNLVPYNDGVCLVGPAPESRRWAMAMISTAAPGEPEAPSWFYVTPPEPSWPEQEQEEWLEVFSATTLPGIVVHEVAPGHFSHGRALRRVAGPVRRTLHSAAFVEGWAHYAEELCVEEGYLSDDPWFAVGVWLEALVRVTRLACSIGVHTAGMTVEEGARRFAADTHLAGPAALSEARRATFDPTYGRYTWGKLEIMDLREQARKRWGNGFTLLRFHTALMELGSPPLGLLATAVDRG